ncbi:hypothetical protein HMPREF1985_01554 [Mitsuokella sp. oral taxon 131 str. W9106]|nr:hypothetical protein HMPREF1985_01554 [Mitsuokella sp. oral taxon 131 str. W9106]
MELHKIASRSLVNIIYTYNIYYISIVFRTNQASLTGLHKNTICKSKKSDLSLDLLPITPAADRGAYDPNGCFLSGIDLVKLFPFVIILVFIVDYLLVLC